MIQGGCAVQLILARARRRGADWDQVWDSGARQVLCVTSGIRITLAPGESRDVSESFSVTETLGDSLPADEYRASVVLHGTQTIGPLSAGRIALSR